MAPMDSIWAPWRLDYVQLPDKEEHGCFLCHAARTDDERGAHVLWRTELSVAVLNRFPYNNGHILVAPRTHKAELADLDADEIADQMELLKRCRSALLAAVKPDGFNIGMNIGRTAGAGVPGHAHWHIVPRWQGDSNFMPVVGNTKVIPQSLDALWRLLRGETA